MTPQKIETCPADARPATFAKDQPQYRQLPAVVFSDGLVVTRWRLSLRERLRVLFGSGIFVSKLTFNQPLQPMKVGITFEDVQ